MATEEGAPGESSKAAGLAAITRFLETTSLASLPPEEARAKVDELLKYVDYGDTPLPPLEEEKDEPKTVADLTAIVTTSLAHFEVALGDAKAVIAKLAAEKEKDGADGDDDAAAAVSRKRAKADHPQEEEDQQQVSSSSKVEESSSKVPSSKVDESSKVLSFERRKLARKGTVLYAAMKGYSRCAFKAAHETREAVAKRKALVDHEDAKLRSLQYRARRLRDEVDVVKSFECEGLAKIREAGGVDVDVSEAVVDDGEHQKRLDLLNAELEERRRLDDVHKKARDLLATRKAACAALREAVASLPAKLDALRRAAEPIRTSFDIGAMTKKGLLLRGDDDDDHRGAQVLQEQEQDGRNVSFQKGRRRRRSSLFEEDPDVVLPAALYSLSRQLEAALATDDSLFDDDDDEKDDDDTGGSAAVVAVEAAEPVTVSWSGVDVERGPAAVALRVPASKRIVKFYHVAFCDVVTVDVLDLGDSSSSSADLVDLDSAPGDDADDRGDALPNVAAFRCLAALSKKQEDPDLTFPVETLGRPFAWAQRLAFGGRASSPTTDADAAAANKRKRAPHPAVSCRATLRKLMERLAALDALDAQIDALATTPRHVTLHPAAPPGLRTALSSVASSTVLTGFAKAPGSGRSFVATVQHQRSKTTLKCLVRVPPTYPRDPPQFALTDDAARKHALTDLQLELNAHSDDLVTKGGKDRFWLLTHQVARLLICFDGLLSEPTHLGRHRRGKDRRRPFVFDPDLNALTHRLI